MKGFVTMDSVREPYIAGDFFIPLGNGSELIVPLEEGIDLAAWLLKSSVKIAIEQSEAALKEGYRWTPQSWLTLWSSSRPSART